MTQPQKRTPKYCYKLRKATTGNKTGDNYAVTVPEIVAKQFENVTLFLTTTPTSIIFESGCCINKITNNI